VSAAPEQEWTVQRMLAWMAQDFAALGVSSPRLDAELLLSHALGCDRVRLYMDMPRPLDSDELTAVRALVVRRRKREPVAYILGRKEFYRRTFAVTKDVLVPRPETEVLVDRALEALPADAGPALDLCTGSGVIAISLALERASLQVDATDVSPAALAIARKNAEQLAASERVQFHEGDLFSAVPAGRQYALITANPPYVADGDWSTLAPEITGHEPRLALTSGDDGLDVLRRLCAQVADHLLPGGVLLFELGLGQANTVRELLQQEPRLGEIVAHKDLAGIERIVQARRALEAGDQT
jgi:release factor glutamine methyltransferase